MQRSDVQGCLQVSTARRKRDLRPSDARRLAAQMRGATEWALFVLNALNTSAALLVPCALVTRTHADIVPGFLITISAVILWMKLVSYAHCNYDLRCGVQPLLRWSFALRFDILLHHSGRCWCSAVFQA